MKIDIEVRTFENLPKKLFLCIVIIFWYDSLNYKVMNIVKFQVIVHANLVQY